MKEYTLAACIAAAAAVLLDRVLGTRLTARRTFWIFQGVMIVAEIIVNGYLTARPIVLYGSEYYLGIRLWTIPLEDFVYGFSFLTFSLVLWEHFRRNAQRRG